MLRELHRKSFPAQLGRKNYQRNALRTSIFTIPDCPGTVHHIFVVHLVLSGQFGPHGNGRGPSFPSVAIAPAIENADNTNDVNRTSFAIVLFTEISPPSFLLIPKAQFDRVRSILNKRLDFIGFRNFENPPDRPVETGTQYIGLTLLSIVNS